MRLQGYSSATSNQVRLLYTTLWYTKYITSRTKTSAITVTPIMITYMNMNTRSSRFCENYLLIIDNDTPKEIGCRLAPIQVAIKIRPSGNE